MNWWRRIIGRLEESDRRDAEFERELRDHLDLEAEECRESGLSPEEARYAALRAFGNTTLVKEEVRAAHGGLAIGHLLQDLRHAARMLRRDARFTAIAVFTLALGVGVTTAMFGLVDTLMFRPPAYVFAPEQVVKVLRANNYVQYLDRSSRARTLDLTAYTRQDLSFGRGVDATTIGVECVTPNYFSLLGAQPAIGRTFAANEDAQIAQPTVVVASGLWKRQLGGGPGVIGRMVAIAGRDYTVIGVAPPGFKGVEPETVDAWILLAVSPKACSFTGTNLLFSSSGGWLTTIGRVRDGFSVAQVEADLASLGPAEQASRVPPLAVRARELEPIYESRRNTLALASRVAMWLSGGAAIVLLIACANVAGLLSIRAIDRRREIAIRLQLGATRARVFVQLLVENLVLAFFCGLVAVAVAAGIGRLLQSFFPLATDDAWLNPRAAGLVASFALLAGILSGVVPAIQASRTDDMSVLRSGRSIIRERSRFRSVLLVVQVALALVLAVGAGLFVQSLANARKDIGYDLDRVIVARFDFQRAMPRRNDEEIRALFDLLLERVRQMPQVQTASVSSGSVLGSGGGTRVTSFRRSVDVPLERSKFYPVSAVSHDYFSTLGIRIVRGRPFGPEDNAASRPVMIVDDALAKEIWPGEDAVGQCAVVFGRDSCVEVVGLSESRHQITGGSREWFVPIAQGDFVPQTLLIRSRTPSDQSRSSIATGIRGAAPDLPVGNIQSLADLADVRIRSRILAARMFRLFGSAAVALAAIGLYGLLAFSTRQRTPEIGIRMALGARPGQILVLVVRHGLILVTIGWALGSVVVLAMTGFLRSLLFGVAPTDGSTFLIASLIVFATALAGSLIPAFRAARIDSAVALRCE